MTTNAATRLAVGRVIYSQPGPSVRRSRRSLSALIDRVAIRLHRLLRRLRLRLRIIPSFRPEDILFGPED